MTTEELQAIRGIMREEISNHLNPINQRLDKIDERLEGIEEQLTDINGAINEIGDWVEKASDIVHIPYADTPAGKEMLRQLLEEQAQSK